MHVDNVNKNLVNNSGNINLGYTLGQNLAVSTFIYTLTHPSN